MADWLYPLSSQSGYRFGFPDGGSSEDASPTALEQLVSYGPSVQRSWHLATNFRKVSPGDTVWLYYGKSDGDRGRRSCNGRHGGPGRAPS